MNRYINSLMVLLVAAATSGCELFDTEEPEKVDLISVVSDADENLSFMGGKDSRQVYIYSEKSWTASSDCSWCTVFPLSGFGGSNQLTISVASNEVSEGREAVITLTSGEAVAYIYVSQAGVQPSVIKITHLGSFFRMPLFEGVFSGTVRWGDGSRSDFSEAKDHEYDAPGQKVVRFELLGDDSALQMDIKGIEGITEIDISGI